MSYSVSQNTTFYTAASILQKAVSFIYFTIVARALGVTDTGMYFFAISFTTIFTVIADAGLAPVLTREVAKFPKKSKEYFQTIFWMKVVFGIAAYMLIVAAVMLMDYSPLQKMLILVSGCTMFFDNLQNVFSSLFRANRNMLYESVSIVLSQTITLAIGLFAIHNHWPMWSLILAYTLASATTLGYFAWCVGRVLGIAPHFTFDKVLAKKLVLLALPFGLAGLISRLYAYSDSVIMSQLLDAEHLGWWSVPYKMTFAFQFIPVAVSTSVYPVMSAWSLGEVDKMAQLFERAWKYLLLIALPLAFGLGVLARPVITLVYGTSYGPSVPILQILLPSLVFGFLSFITGATLNATNNQKKQTALLGITLGVNLILNLILIPRLATIGAAIAALIGNICLAVGGYFLSAKVIPLSVARIANFALRIFIAAGFMGVFVHYTIVRIPWYWGIPVGALVYGCMLFVTAAISSEEIQNFKQKFFVRHV